MMDCIVLAGGLGTRLRAVVSDRPKPLALINGIPFLALPMHVLLASKLVRKAVIAVSYQAESIVDFFSLHPFSIPIEFSWEEQPLGTGGAVKKALEKTSSEHVLIINGDSYLDFSLQKLFEQHQQQGDDVTIVYTHARDAARFGRLEIDNERKKIRAFREKTACVEPGLINAGIYLFRRSLFESLTLPEQFSLERDLFPQLVPRGMAAFCAPGSFIDIGTPDSYREAQTLLAPLTKKISSTGIDS